MRPIKFAIVGGIGTVLGIIFLWFFNEVLFLHYSIAAIIAIELSVLTNFTMNQIWTFGDRVMKNGIRELWRRVVKYHSITFVGMVINMIVILVSVSLFSFNQYLAYVLGVLIGYLWNYSFSNRWAWKAKK